MTVNDFLTPKEKEYLQQLKKQGYVSLQRSNNGQLLAIKEGNELLIDYTYFSCISENHTIHIDYLLLLSEGFSIPVINVEKPTTIVKYRETISKKRLTEWLTLLKEGYYSELRKQIEKEISKSD